MKALGDYHFRAVSSEVTLNRNCAALRLAPDQELQNNFYLGVGGTTWGSFFLDNTANIFTGAALFRQYLWKSLHVRLVYEVPPSFQGIIRTQLVRFKPVPQDAGSTLSRYNTNPYEVQNYLEIEPLWTKITHVNADTDVSRLITHRLYLPLNRIIRFRGDATPTSGGDWTNGIDSAEYSYIVVNAWHLPGNSPPDVTCHAHAHTSYYEIE